MERQLIVVWDPEGKYWEGSLVSDATSDRIKGRGGATLPVDPALFQLSGVGGYFKRSWGAGWPCEHSIPKMFCPMTLFITPEHRILHWVARIVPDENHAHQAESKGIDGPGTLTIMSYTARANTYTAPVTPETQVQQLRLLGATDKLGGWTVGGRAIANPSVEGNHAFALYGAAQGIRVAWAALSVVKA